MQKMMRAWLYKPSTVVVDKRQIVNAKDENFEEISLVIPLHTIQQWNEEIEMIGLDEDYEEMDELEE